MFFLFQQEIAEAGEAAVQKYYESVPDLAKRRSDHAIQALHDGMQAKLMSFLNQFHKQLALADPALTNNFLL